MIFQILIDLHYIYYRYFIQLYLWCFWVDMFMFFISHCTLNIPDNLLLTENHDLKIAQLKVIRGIYKMSQFCCGVLKAASQQY